MDTAGWTIWIIARTRPDQMRAAARGRAARGVHVIKVMSPAEA